MIKVAVIGVGNCASSLVQGVQLYKDLLRVGKPFPGGIMMKDVGGYGPEDVEFVAAFDIDANKVGKDLNQAIFEMPNNTLTFHNEMGTCGIKVSRGMTNDSLGKYTRGVYKVAAGPTCDVVSILKGADVDVVINYLPVGSETATKWYVEQILKAGCALVNCMPVFIASDKSGYWPSRFEDAGVPVIGDDIKSQLGATIVNRVLARLCEDRGITITNMYQLNFGGNMDFLNMLDRDRLESKKISKTGSVQSQLHKELDGGDIHVGPSDYVPWLKDRKWAYIRIEGTNFGGAPLSMEVKLEVWDSPNSAGVVIDAIRCAKVALDRQLRGPIKEPSAYYMKTPPQQYTDDEARNELVRWLGC